MAVTAADLGNLQTQLNGMAEHVAALTRRFEQAGIMIPDLVEQKTAEVENRMGQFKEDVKTYANTASE